ncbi:MAG: aa3-type cytochrome c oxidase subunit IV [Cohaesibacteraceae bacterium]
MADAAEKDLPVSNDYVEHNRTFEVFITLVKWGTIATAVVLILMAIFLL